ncbi:FliM/FliN family flagellar motor switch protein [Yoonia sp. MH D7]
MQTSILARMVVRQAEAVADVPLTSSRALRVAMTRAADKAIGLPLTVSNVGEEFLQLDAVIEALPASHLYAALVKGCDVVGLVGLDAQMRAAVIEIQTIGSLTKNPQLDRPPTSTDMMLAAPICEKLLALLPETTTGSELEGWAADVTLGAVFDSLRAAGLALEENDYRLMRLTLDFSVAGRQGEIILALPNHTSQPVAPVEEAGDAGWNAKMDRAVAAAPATLNAILCQMKLSIGKVDGMQVGDVLPLYGATVSSVRLFAPDGVEVGTAKLGQSGGMRAVRIETPVSVPLGDLPAPKSSQKEVTVKVD